MSQYIALRDRTRLQGENAGLDLEYAADNTATNLMNHVQTADDYAHPRRMRMLLHELPHNTEAFPFSPHNPAKTSAVD